MRDPPLPPLNALRAFEAVARHGNVTRAARELGVTQTAASHQIGTLERFLGVDLVTRAPGGVALTQAGRAWADALTDVFERLRDANRRLRRPPGPRLVSVSVMPSFGTRWLVPRLGRFLAAHPDIDVRISSSERLVDFATEDVDVGVRYGRRPRVGPHAEHLFDDRWVVVCAPGRAVGTVAELAQVPLLCDDEPGGWVSWLESAGYQGPLPRWSELSDSATVVDAAVGGVGVALARYSLAADALGAGQVVRPFPDVPLARTGRAYFLAGPPGPFRPEVEAFRAWVRDEMTALAASVPG
jgi:LysR family transcriptional regulator, glycine cleavage system transcriptional activator